MCLAVIPYITPKDPELVSSRLWHPGFHAGNVYIDDQARISSIIDWQGAWTSALFIGAHSPLLLDYGIDMLMKLPEGFKSLNDATRKRDQIQSVAVRFNPHVRGYYGGEEPAYVQGYANIPMARPSSN